MNVEKGMQSENVRIRERNRRETEKILRNIAEHENEIQEEMFKEFDQSIFDLDLQGFRRNLFLTGDLSDCSNMETDPNLYLANIVTSSPANQNKPNNISDRIKTQIRMKSILSRNTEICDGDGSF